MLRSTCLGLTLSLIPVAVSAQIAELFADYTWPAEAHGYGGFSAIELERDGKAFIAVSDRGASTRGQLRRDADGRIVDVESEPVRALLGPDGAIMPPEEQDAEGIAVDAEGRIYISFEGVHRVLRYDRYGGPATLLPVHPDFADFELNKSLEALAIDADGTLYTLPEESDDPRGFPVYRYRGGAWDQPFHIPREDRFLAAGADIGPDGRFYLLERDFRLWRGFASRVRRFDLSEESLSGEVIVFQSEFMQHDNLEGISVWRDEEGLIRITMISDDNFFPIQRTQIVEYRVAE